MIVKNFGPPGTGKTTRIVEMLAELVHRKEVNPSRIYATSLTRATKWAFLKKAYEKGVAVPEENIRTVC